MLERIRAFLRDGGETGSGSAGKDELSLAVAGLLVDAAHQDGDFDERELLGLVQQHYGQLSPFELPTRARPVEPAQTRERRVEHKQPTDTEKLEIGRFEPNPLEAQTGQPG